MEDYVQGAQRKMQLIAQSTLKEIHENSISIIDQSHATKFDQKQYFRLSFCYTCLYVGWLAKEAIDHFFFKAINKKIKKSL